MGEVDRVMKNDGKVIEHVKLPSPQAPVDWPKLGKSAMEFKLRDKRILKEMSDHLILFVNRLVTDSTLQDVTPYNMNRIMRESSPPESGDVTDEFAPPSDIAMAAISPPTKLVQCRICHEEDDALKLEAPCSCNGSLKYAHHNCVQRWCNEKGDTDCEICLQQLRPNYTAPPPSRCNGTPLSFRGITWDVSGRDMHDYTEVSHFDYEDYSYPKGLVCCRIVAIIFLVLLVSRYTLPVVLSGVGEYSLTLLTVLVLRTIGILLPVYIMIRVFLAIRQAQRESVLQTNLNSAEEENELPEWQTTSRFIQGENSITCESSVESQKQIETPNMLGYVVNYMKKHKCTMQTPDSK